MESEDIRVDQNGQVIDGVDELLVGVDLGNSELFIGTEAVSGIITDVVVEIVVQ